MPERIIELLSPHISFIYMWSSKGKTSREEASGGYWYIFIWREKGKRWRLLPWWKDNAEYFHAEEKKITWKYCRMAMFCGKRPDMIRLAVTLLQQKIVAENCFIKEAAWSLWRLKKESWSLSYWRLRGRWMRLEWRENSFVLAQRVYLLLSFQSAATSFWSRKNARMREIKVLKQYGLLFLCWTTCRELALKIW